VIAFLLMYFVVAVLGNWLFFSWLKRREWAWAALVAFSIGFTAYAMVYGTSGRARSSELHQIQVVRVPKDGGLCAVDSLTGILTAQTGRYTLDIQHPYALAEDLYYGSAWTTPQRGGLGIMSGREVKPFTLVQGEPPRIEDYRIGASELRMIRLHTDVECEGGIEGKLEFTGDKLRGQLVNRTGFPLTTTYICFRGVRYDIGAIGDRFDVNIAVQSGAGEIGLGYGNPYASGSWIPPEALRSTFLQTLLVSRDTQTGMLTAPRMDLGPFLCGWSTSRHAPTVTSDASLKQKTNETLIVADVDVTYANGTAAAVSFGNLRRWATERTADFDRITQRELPDLEKAVMAEVVRDPNDEAVSDLIGNFSTLAGRFGPKSAAELADAWGVKGKEREEAALWDRMIQAWCVSRPEQRVDGVASLSYPPNNFVQALSQGDYNQVQRGLLSRFRALDHVREIQGFVHLDRFDWGQISMPFPQPGPGGRAYYNNFVVALTELWSPDERDVTFAHGSDDWTRIWINGVQVHSALVARDATPNQDHFTAHLKAGRNVVVVECGNEVGEWEFCLAPEEGGDGLEVRVPGIIGTGEAPGSSSPPQQVIGTRR
jgi:hypothetical protein